MTLHDGSTSDRVLAGRYRLGARRGAGVDIAVFDAMDLGLGRAVVVKIIHPDLCAAPGFDERFRSTMQRVASIDHPNVGRVLDWGRADWNGRPVEFVVTDVLGGGSVRDLLDRGRQLTSSQTVMIGLDVCRGLDVAHRLGVVHGDIRPATLVFGDDGKLRIIDLGLSRLVSEPLWVDPSHVSLDRARYAAPEQAAGGIAETKSDVYSLCLTLIEVLTGQVPFMGDSSVATMQNRIDKLMPVSADYGPLAAVLERAGRPDPADRSTAAEFGRALVQAAEKLPRPAPIALPGTGLFSGVPSAPTQAAPTQAAPTQAAPTQAAPIPAAPIPTAPPVSGPDPTMAMPRPPVPPQVGSFDPPSGQVPVVAVVPVGPAVAPVPASPPAFPSLLHAAAPIVPSAPSPDLPGADPSAPIAMPVWAADPSTPTPRPPFGGSDDLVIAVDASGPISREPARIEPTTVAPEATRMMPATAIVPPPPQPDNSAPILRERRSRRKLLAVILVVLLAAGIGGGAAWWLGRDTSHTVPALVGLEQAEALNQISEFGWTTTVTEESSDTVAVGVVIRTDPPAGSKLGDGKAFMIVASKGPAPRALPELVGATVEQATATLTGLQLGLQEADRQFSETIPADTIISWSVPTQPGLRAGDTVVPGTVVVVVASAGPAPRTIPDFTGASLADATTALEAAGLVIVQLPDEFSDTVLAGAIARQDPAPGATVPAGGSVSVAVSKGQDLVVVPPLAALTVQQASDALTAAGLVLGQVQGDPTGVAVLAEVDGQSIGANVSLPRGTKVDVTFEVPPPPTTLPPETTTTTIDPAATTTVPPG